MSFQTTKQDGVVVVDVDGQLIVGNRQELKQKVLDELENGERKFLIDFANTGYIDSSGRSSAAACWCGVPLEEDPLEFREESVPRTNCLIRSTAAAAPRLNEDLRG
jgi:MFS superfamily sulfate permease-like transporter